jgi:hypothetical protein
LVNDGSNNANGREISCGQPHDARSIEGCQTREL